MSTERDLLDLEHEATDLPERPMPTWEDRVMSVLQRVGSYFADTDAPLGEDARRLVMERLVPAAVAAGIISDPRAPSGKGETP